MTRHELKDGKWYLMKNKNNNFYCICQYNDNRAFWFDFLDHCEWVEIDPEQIFNAHRDKQ